MKKALFITIALIWSVAMTQAQVCKISETGDNVEVFSAVIENNNSVVVTVGNDSQNTSANVTVSVEVTYERTSKKTYVFTGKVIAKPNQQSVIIIKIPEKDENGRVPKTVKVTNISGTKCM